MRLFGNKKGLLPEQGKSFASQRRHILGKNSSFYVQEAYKTLRTNVRFSLSGEGCKKFCITSGMASEGKSITMLNLAISFAQTGQKVLLIDADLRRPSLAKLLVEKATPGLSNVLVGMCRPEDAIRESPFPNLDILLSGEIPPNPSELLGNHRMKNLIDQMSQVYDYILVDTPPVGIVADTCVVASYLDGVLFLIRQGRTEKDIVARGVRQLEMSDAKLMGFVLNGAEQEGGTKYKYKYRYQYKYGYSANVPRDSRSKSQGARYEKKP